MPADTTAAAHAARRIDALAEVYARSLLEAIDGQGDVQPDTIETELGELVELIEADPQRAALIYGRQLTQDQRRASIDKIFKDRVSDVTWRFLQVLNAKDRLGHLPTIRAAFEQQLKQRRGEVDVLVYSAKPLDDAQKQTVGDRISAAINAKALIHNRVDERLIGGLKLRIGDQLLDGSVARQLDKMKATLIRRGRESAREGNQVIEEEAR